MLRVLRREQAIAADIPVIPGTDGPAADIKEMESFVDEVGYSVMIKAALGGGGRGMCLVEHAKD